MCPLRWARRYGSAAWVTHSAPNRLVSSWARPGLGEFLDEAEVPVAGVVDHDVQPAEVVVRGLTAEVGVPVGDVQRDRQQRVAVLLRQVGQVSVLRAVAATLSPRSRAAIAHSRPKPREVPVMNQTFRSCVYPTHSGLSIPAR